MAAKSIATDARPRRRISSGSVLLPPEGPVPVLGRLGPVAPPVADACGVTEAGVRAGRLGLAEGVADSTPDWTAEGLADADALALAEGDADSTLDWTADGLADAEGDADSALDWTADGLALADCEADALALAEGASDWTPDWTADGLADADSEADGEALAGTTQPLARMVWSPWAG